MKIESTPVEILLVEDNPQDADLTLRALRRHNLANSVHVARDGVEALDYFFAGPDAPGMVGPPKVVFLDLKLPRVDGIEVLRRLRADERTKGVPVVALTSSQEDRDIIATYTIGINSYITKPVDFAEFSKAIEELGLYWLVLNRGPESLPATGKVTG